ncbi:MAG: hypothetical protein LBP86_06490 [Azoarcus sp.]|jgi:hypothetical protein|nr:hypothetical protein [Azoarcus sp.]
MKSKWVRHLAILSAAIALTGCASFRNNEVAEVTSLPDVSQYQNKPSVFVEVLFLRGETGGVASELPAAKPEAQEIVGKVLGDSGLFSKYSFNNVDKQTADYTLHVSVHNHGNTPLAIISGFISGLTFALVPGAATDNYTLTAKLIDNTGAVISETANTDSITTWIGWFLIPAASNTPAKAFSQTVGNQLKAILNEWVESGKLKYSQIPSHMTLHRFARR